ALIHPSKDTNAPCVGWISAAHPPWHGGGLRQNAMRFARACAPLSGPLEQGGLGCFRSWFDGLTTNGRWGSPRTDGGAHHEREWCSPRAEGGGLRERKWGSPRAEVVFTTGGRWGSPRMEVG